MSRPKLPKDAAITTLESVGLSENESLLYSLMLTLPGSTVQELATRAPLPRTLLYYVLNQLIQKGLVSSHKETWRTIYLAEDPERLYEILASKEQVFERHRESVRELIPELKRKYRLAGKRPSARIFEGSAEYRKALEDSIIAKPKEIRAFEALDKKRPAIEIRETYERRRVARKIKKNILFFENTAALQALKERGYDDYTQYRNVEREIAPFETDLMLYDGKLLYTSYSDEHEPTAILIEDHALYEMQKNLFDRLWKQGKDRTLAYTGNL
jgi:sugar-specific transcriptional regulator TrmB